MSMIPKCILEQLEPCSQCGSEDLAWCGISHRPYCKECNNWGVINFGSDDDAIRNWNRRINHHIVHEPVKEVDRNMFLANKIDKSIHYDFSTPDGFFRLWNWVSTKDWFFDFKFWFSNKNTQYAIAHELINPEVFASELHEYIKRKGL